MPFIGPRLEDEAQRDDLPHKRKRQKRDEEDVKCVREVGKAVVHLIENEGEEGERDEDERENLRSHRGEMQPLIDAYRKIDEAEEEPHEHEAEESVDKILGGGYDRHCSCDRDLDVFHGILRIAALAFSRMPHGSASHANALYNFSKPPVSMFLFLALICFIIAQSRKFRNPCRIDCFFLFDILIFAKVYRIM